MRVAVIKLSLSLVLLASFNSYANCMAEAETASEMHMCLTSELQGENVRMQEILYEVYDSSPHLLKEVRKSQRDWESYKESHCQAISKRYNSGDMGVISHPLCLLDITQLRIGELELLISH